MQDGSPQSLPAIDAVRGRKSVRQFLKSPVDEATVLRILDDAARAPSGTNSQPWGVQVVMGAARERLCKAVTAAAIAGDMNSEYPYAPKDWWEPFIARRRKVGFDLYALAGIKKDDMAGRQRQSLRNFSLFDAPVGLFFTMDRRLLHGSWIDLGMFMQNVMTLARAYGLETCPQAAWLHFGHVVHRELGIADGEILISGMALGHADWSAKVNELISERAPASEFAKVHR